MIAQPSLCTVIDRKRCGQVERPTRFSSSTRRTRTSGVSLLLVALAAIILSERPSAAGFNDAPGIPRDEQDRTDVYLNDSFEAQDAIRNGRRLAGTGRWEQAANILQQTADSLGEKLVALDAHRYVGVRRHVSDIIAAWPPEGIAVYRALVDRRLGRETLRLEQPGDLRAGLLLLEQYYCATQSPSLIEGVVHLALEAGELQLALRVLQRAINRHPDRQEHGRRWRALVTICKTLAGSDSGGADTHDADTTLRWMGEDAPIAQIVRRLRASSTGPSVPGDASQQWPIFGGSSARSRIGTTTIDELGLIWRFRKDQTHHDPDDYDDADDFDAALGRARAEAAMSTHAVADNHYIVLQRHREVIALHRKSGALAWRFQPDEGSGDEFQDAEDRAPSWESVVIQGDRVYAALPGDVVPFYGFESARVVTELVCLDLHSGRLLWRANQDTIGAPFRELQLDAAPLVARNRMLVVGRRRRSFGFEDCYLYAFSTDSGEFIFRTHLGSATAGTLGAERPTMSIPAMDDDTVFVCSNLGSVAAVSLHTGAVRWLLLYERRLEDSADDGQAWSSYELRSWEFNPLLLVDNKVCVLPNDSDRLFVLDKESGSRLDSFPLDALGGMRTLLGVRDDVICGTGAEAACFDIDRGYLRWTSPLPRDERAVGRGTWVGDRLLVPTQSRLCSFNIDDGTRTDQPWHAEGEPGNLLALPDVLIVSGGRHVSAYVRKEQIWASLRARMKASPDDPVPALELAEIAFGSGEVADALAALAEAVRRADTDRSQEGVDVRARVHNNAVGFAQRLAVRKKLDVATLKLLLGYAADFATAPTMHMEYRFRFADIAQRLGAHSTAAKLLQQVLLDRSLSDLPEPGRQPSGTTAGDLAESRIETLIAERGRDVFAEFDEDAARLLDKALANSDASMLRRIVREYPNSNAAPRALLAVGQRFVASGDGNAAARTFVQAYHRFRGRVDPAHVMRSIADAYELAGKEEHAYLWLTKAAQEHPSVLIDVGGTRQTLEQYRRRLAHVQARVQPQRPRIRLPLSVAQTRTLQEGERLLPPRFMQLPACRWGVYFLSMVDGIAAYDSKTHQRLWVNDISGANELELLLATDAIVLLASASEIVCLDIDTGKRRWSLAGHPGHEDAENLDDAPQDWEERGVFRNFAVHRNRMIAVRHDGRMTCLDLADGHVVWIQERLPPAAGVIRMTDEWVAFHASGPGRPTLVRLDAEDGSIHQSFPSDDSRPVEDLFLTLDGPLVVATSQSVAVYDVGARQPRWRIDLTGHLKPDSLAIDIGAVYLSQDGRRLWKFSLEDGSEIWSTQRLHPRGAGSLQCTLIDGQVIAATPSSITAVDAVTGVLLWEGATQDSSHFVAQLVTDRYVVAVHVPEDAEEGEGVAYCYQHRNASGLLPRDGGALGLGSIRDLRAVICVDGSLLLQTGNELRTWTHAP